MKARSIFHLTARLLVLFITVVSVMPVMAQDNPQYALYNYRNDGDFNAWLNIDIDSITFSCFDLDSIEHDDVVVQEVWTPDSVYRIPIESIDSIGFRAPAPVMRDGIFYLRDYHAAHTLDIDSLTLYFNKNIKNDSLPYLGQVVLSSTKKSPFEEGFAGRVIKIEQQSNSLKVECEMIAVGDVYKRLVLVGKSVSDTDSQSLLKIKHDNSDPWIDLEDSGIKKFEKIGDFEFSCLNGILSVKSIDPTLIVNYYVYVDEFVYSLSADLSLIHHNLETHLNLSIEKILEMAEINKDVGDALKRLRDFKNVDQWLADLLKEQIQEENKEKESKDEIDIIKEIWKDLHFKKSIPIVGPLLLDIEVGPLLKFKGDLEYDMTLKNKAINTFHINAKGYTMATLSNPKLAMMTGLANVDGYATFESEPYTDVTVEANAKGRLSLGFTGKLGFSLIHKNVVHISMEVQAGVKASAALNLKFMDTEVDENDRTPYEAIKETKIKLEKFAKATAEFGVTPSDFFAIDQEWEFWSEDIGVWYLVPHFSKPALPTYKDGHWSNGDTRNHLVLQSLPTKEIPDPFFGPCKVALRIVDDEGNIVKGTEAREYKDDNTLVWQLYPMEIDLTGLTPGKTYRCYPILNYFNWKPLVATPSYEFTVPNPLSLEAETIYLKKGESRNVQILGGWGDYLVFSLKPSVCSAELLNEGDDYYVHIVGKSNETTTISVRDLRTNDTKVILVKVADEPVGESTITVTPQQIDYGEVEAGSYNLLRYVTISNSSEQERTVTLKLDNYNFWSLNLVSSDGIGGGGRDQEIFTKKIQPGEQVLARLSFKPSNVGEYNCNLIVTSEELEGWKCTVPVKAKYVEDPSFHLSSNTVDVYVNDYSMVYILNGSGEYDIINDYFDIVEADINVPHVAHIPPLGDISGGKVDDATDSWYITGKKVGHAVLKLKDKETNEVLTLNVEVKQAPHLTLSAQSVELGMGETDSSIEIKAGSDWYDISSDNPEIVTASKTNKSVSWVDEYGVAHGGTFVEIKGQKAGNAKVTVTDMSSGETAEIQVKVKGDDMVSFLSCPDEHHPHLIDLGLPSGTKWACCNVDDDHAKQSPTNYGSYYAWGETKEHEDLIYNWSTYTHCDGSYDTCHDLGSDIAGTQYDVAHVKWGSSWVMPSHEQRVELFNNCSSEWTSLNGVYGRIFTGKNGNSIFLPAAGFRLNNDLLYVDDQAFYWLSTLQLSERNCAYHLYFNADIIHTSSYYYRNEGRPVRPVVVNDNTVSLQISTTTLNLTAGSEGTVDITSGSGSYDAVSNDKSVATVTVDGSKLIIKAVGAGTATITVKDNQTQERAKIEVTVSDTPQAYLTCPDDHHPHLIDLGLPSGTKWACCNVGADKPEAYGGYYAWGETEEKSVYNWSTYIHCDGSWDTCHDLGSDIAGTQYDVAHVQWGGSWVMPSKEQQDELRNNCTSKWTTLNGVNGWIFTGPNGGSIFLPAAGIRYDSALSYVGSDGGYWSSAQTPSYSGYAYYLYFYSGSTVWSIYSRGYGRSVRPVVRN